MADTNALIGTQLKTFPGSYFNYSSTGWTIDGATEKGAVVFQVPEACDITGMATYCTAIASPPAYKFTLQGVDASGDPDGSVKATTAEFTPSASSREAHAFVAAYSAVQGELLAGVWEYSSGIVSASNDASMTGYTTVVRYNAFPFATFYGGSSWNPDYDSYPAFTLQTDEDWDAGGLFVVGVRQEQAVSSTGHRFAQRVQIPADEDIELHVDGFYFMGDVEISTGDEFKAAIWNAAGSELASISIDSSQQAARRPDGRSSREFTLAADATITAGDVFYMGFENTGDNLSISYAEPGGADGLNSWPGGAAFYASYWNGSSWADDLTKRLCLNPTLSSFHGTASGGSAKPSTTLTMGVFG